MLGKPAVSVVIPLYNKGPYIARALNSVLVQTFRDFEVIVIDDGSTDNGAQIVRGFNDSHIRLIQQENQGVSAARNRGIIESCSEFIAFLDADDEWLPEFLETILNLRKSYPNAGAYATAYIRSETDGTISYPQKKWIPGKNWEGTIPNYFALILKYPPICSSSVGIPRDVFSQIGKFQEDFGYGEDLDMWFRIALKYEIAFSSKNAAIYHIQKNSSIKEKKNNDVNIELVYFTVKSSLNDEKIQPKYIPFIKEYFSQIQLGLAFKYIMSGNDVTARKMIINIKTKKFFFQKFLLFYLSFLPVNFLKYFLVIQLKIKKHILKDLF